MIRLFVGLELPEQVRQQLNFMTGGIPQARWTDVANFHLTLAFIGEVEEPVAQEIDALLDEIREPAFDLTISGVGQFDRGGHTRIVWAGVESNAALTHLQGKVATSLARHGIPVDTRKFSPHVTLARIGHGASQDRVFRFLADHSLFAAGRIRVDRFTLFESIRGNGTPVYVPLRQYELGDSI